MIIEKMWGEGGKDEHWATVQTLDPSFDDDVPTGEVLGHFVEQYALAQRLVSEGYELYEQLDESNLLWVKYTETLK